jgi:hypothetical protein
MSIIAYTLTLGEAILETPDCTRIKSSSFDTYVCVPEMMENKVMDSENIQAHVCTVLMNHSSFSPLVLVP